MQRSMKAPTPGCRRRPPLFPTTPAGPVPKALTKDDMKRLIEEFVSSTKRIEPHWRRPDRTPWRARLSVALLPVAAVEPTRTDEYGGSYRKPHALPARDVYRMPCARRMQPECKATGHPRLGVRLGRWRLDARGNRDLRQRTQGARLRLHGRHHRRPVIPRKKSRWRPVWLSGASSRRKVKKETGLHHDVASGLIAGTQRTEDIIASGKAGNDMICDRAGRDL